MKTERMNNIDLNLDLTGVQNPALVHPIVRILRVIGVVTLLMTYFILAIPFYPLLKMKPAWTKNYIIGPFLRLLSVLLLKVFGYKVTKKGNFDVEPGTVIASNHMNAYLDMMLIWSVSKGSFLSTVEVQAMPLFGQIAELAGCIFIDRRTRENLPEEIEKVTAECKKGVSLIFFPEGRTYDGSEVLRFKRPFFTPATAQGKDIQLLTMNYKAVSGMPITSANKDQILWYRQAKIVKHMWNLLQFKSVEVEITGDVLKASDYQAKTEVHVADQAHEIAVSRFNPIV